MRETKTKKALFGLFLVALTSLLSITLGAIHTDTTYAAECNTKYAYTLSDDGKTITEKVTGQKENNYGGCVDATDTNKYAQKGDTRTYEDAATGNCGNQVTLSAAPKAGGNVGATFQGYSAVNCIKAGGARTVAVAAGTAYAGTVGEGEDAEGEDAENTTGCSIGGIGWLVCPLIDFGAGIADGAFGFISTTFLETKTDLYNNTDCEATGCATYNAWQWILGFANIIFVVIFLIIIFSQATGFGISNYGIKKMLPKLIIGVILINISFFICQLLIDASNLLGYGLNRFFDTIAAGIPVANADDPGSKGNPIGGLAALVLAGGATAGAVASVGGLFAALALFIPVLLAALIGLLMIFLFLVARQALIVFAIIIAPLAFAAWLLPNTEKLFKRWWSLFTQLLLLFPIIALVFGASKLASKIIAKAYSGDGSNIPDTLATASSVDNGGNFIGQVIAAAVLVVPLFAVPFLLKGAINAVPVVGRLAQRTYGNATGGTRKRTGDMAGLAFGGLRAQQQAGVRNAFGFTRSADAQANKRTVSQKYSMWRKGLEDNVKSYDKMTDENYKEYAQKNAGSLAGRAIRREEQQGVRGAATSAGFESELKAEKADSTSRVGQWDLQRRNLSDIGTTADLQADKQWNEARTASGTTLETNGALGRAGISSQELLERAHTQTSLTQASNFATNKRAGDYSERLANAANPEFIGPLQSAKEITDQSLLRVAGGEVDARGGVKRAQATAVEAGFKIYDQNTAADRALLTQKMSQRNLAILQGEKLDAPNTILRDAMKSGDSNEVLAARDLLMTQGSSGVMTLQSYIRSLEEDQDLGPQGAFSGDRQEILNTLKRTQMSEHGKATKENATGMVAWANSSNTMRMAMQNQGRYTALTDSELGKQSTASLIQGVANGAIDRERAAAILSDDTLRKDYDEQQREVLQMVKDFGSDAVVATWNPDNGRVWIDEKETNPEAIRKAQGEYARYVDLSRQARISTNQQLPPNDPNRVDDEEVQPIGLTPVVPGKLPVPKPNSPTPVIMDYLDKVGGPSRTSKDSFIKLQETLRVAPDAGDNDNDDYRKTVLQMDADSKRRNDEADKINQRARRSRGEDLIPDNQKYTYINGAPGTQEDNNRRQQEQSRNQQRQNVNQTFTQTAQEFNLTPTELNFDARRLEGMDEATLNRVAQVLKAYRGARQSAANTSNADAVTASLRENIKRDLDRAVTGEGWTE